MFDIGLWELACVGTIAFVVLGPEKCLDHSKKLGQWLATLKQQSQQWQQQLKDDPPHEPD
jgi:Sec-independent protein translocase protein TatA